MTLVIQFVEAAIFLMKRKTKKGVQILSSIIENKDLLAKNKFITSIVYLYWAFGYIVLNMFDKSQSDLVTSNTIAKLDSPSFYNLLISQAILHIQNKEFD